MFSIFSVCWRRRARRAVRRGGLVLRRRQFDIVCSDCIDNAVNDDDDDDDDDDDIINACCGDATLAKADEAGYDCHCSSDHPKVADVDEANRSDDYDFNDSDNDNDSVCANIGVVE